MEKNQIVITDCDHPSIEVEKGILEYAGYSVMLEKCQSEEDVMERCQDASGIINQYAPLTRKVLSRLPSCKVIVRYGVGVDNVDIKAAEEFGITVCNVPDYGVEEVSDHALALLFTLTRKIELLSRRVKQNQWDVQISRPITRLKNLTLGIVGLGRIGTALGNKACGLGWNVIAYDRMDRIMDGVNMVSFDELVATSDMISIHTPLEADTYHLFNELVFKRMKKTSVIVNTARGPIIDERALVQALTNGEISGAGIDVLEQEPPMADHPLFSFDNVTLTPHAAWYSEQASHDLKQKAAEEVVRVLSGFEPKNPVNKPLKTEGVQK